MNPPEFKAWPKISRLFRDIVVTEKIDGTNACVVIHEDGRAYAQSRTRVLTLDNDNFGFARWVAEHEEELTQLGPGYHYGEWYGLGIQRGYGLDEKRFMLFNTHRWADDDLRPQCCEVATILYTGSFETIEIDAAIADLRARGSVHVPGFAKPEGIVVYHTHANHLFKVTLEKDEQHKFER